MTNRASPAKIAALIYGTGTDPAPVLRALVTGLAADGLTCAGFIQRDTPRPGRSRCDMVLEDIRTGAPIPISQDRGPGARGCRLDESGLTRAMMACSESLRSGPDVLILNKFGKSESEGRGFRPLIAEAIEREIPLLIAVSWVNIDSWRFFAGDLSIEVPLDAAPLELDDLKRRLGLGRSRETARQAPIPSEGIADR